MPERAAIVTGGSRGIGYAIAKALAEDGFALTITGRQPDNLEQALQTLRSGGADVHGVAMNHVDPDAPAEIVRRHSERYGRLDMLVNNAGIGIGAAADEHQTKHLDLMLNVNLRAIILFYRESLALLKAAAAERGQSHVINLASLAGKNPQPWLSVYSATKSAVVGYTEAMSKEYASLNVKSTAFCPGFVDTDMAEFVKEQLPGEEMIRPADIAEAVRFLLRLSAGCTVPEIVFMRPTETGALV